MRYNFACTMAFQFHEPDVALDLLETVFPLISASAYKAFKTDPDLDSLREPSAVQAPDEGRGGAARRRTHQSCGNLSQRMADVFISYARPDEGQSKRVADALRDAGYAVWRDDELPAHRVYADVIQERLTSAGAVVVLWSKDASKSQWVRAEADAARTLGTLVQVTIDGSMPPMPFNQVQCADLSEWSGDTAAPGWRKLGASVRALAGEPQRDEDTKPRSAKISVCVLPFANMSGDAEQEYFSDGISEDITTDLSKVSALAVIGPQYRIPVQGPSADICDIAKKLDIGHVLEGSVRKAGGRVRITAQLIDGETGDHVWAERYDRDLTDIFAIQDEISHAIVDALKVKLLPGEKGHRAAPGEQFRCVQSLSDCAQILHARLSRRRTAGRKEKDHSNLQARSRA